MHVEIIYNFIQFFFVIERTNAMYNCLRKKKHCAVVISIPEQTTVFVLASVNALFPTAHCEPAAINWHCLIFQSTIVTEQERSSASICTCASYESPMRVAQLGSGVQYRWCMHGRSDHRLGVVSCHQRIVSFFQNSEETYCDNKFQVQFHRRNNGVLYVLYPQ